MNRITGIASIVDVDHATERLEQADELLRRVMGQRSLRVSQRGSTGTEPRNQATNKALTHEGNTVLPECEVPLVPSLVEILSVDSNHPRMAEPTTLLSNLPHPPVVMMEPGYNDLHRSTSNSNNESLTTDKLRQQLQQEHMAVLKELFMDCSLDVASDRKASRKLQGQVNGDSTTTVMMDSWVSRNPSFADCNDETETENGWTVERCFHPESEDIQGDDNEYDFDFDAAVDFEWDDTTCATSDDDWNDFDEDEYSTCDSIPYTRRRWSRVASTNQDDTVHNGDYNEADESRSEDTGVHECH